MLTELLRTEIVASAFAWIAQRAAYLDISHATVLALIIWVGFPLVLLTGSVIWEKVHPATAAIHAGDWLLKLVLIAVIVGILHLPHNLTATTTHTGKVEASAGMIDEQHVSIEGRTA